jgi:hypothetical protein
MDACYYEIKVAVELQDALGYKIYTIDHPAIREFKFETEQKIEEILKQIVMPLQNLDLPSRVLLDRYQKLCDQLYETNPFLREFESAEVLEKEDLNFLRLFLQNLEEISRDREEYVAKGIERLRPEVHICGFLHTIPSNDLPLELRKKFLPRGTLIDRINYLNPKTFKLIEADSLNNQQ